MCQCDLACQYGIVVCDIRFRVSTAVFEFDVQTHRELLEVKTVPEDPQGISDLLCFKGTELSPLPQPSRAANIFHDFFCRKHWTNLSSYAPCREDIVTQ